VRRLAVIVVASLALGAGCKAASTPGDQSVPGQRLVLMSPGTGPRRVLRFDFVEGARQSLDLRLDLKLAIAVNHVDMEVPPLPGVSLRVGVEIGDVLGDGSARWRMEIDHATISNTPEVTPETAAALRAALPAATAIVGSGRLTARGQVAEATIEMPSSVVDPAAAQFLDAVEQLLLRQMACAVPAEAVGVGARWEVRTDLDNAGMKLTHIVVNELVTMDDRQIEIKQMVRQEAAPQSITGAESAGATTDLVALDGRGTASLVVDLTRPWPATYSLDFALDTDMKTAGQPLHVRMSMLAQATTRR